MASVVVFSNLFIIMMVVVVVIGILPCINFTFLSSMGVSPNTPEEEHQQYLPQLKDTTNKNISQSIIRFDYTLPDKQSIGLLSPSKAFNSGHGTDDSKNKNNWITVNHDIYGTRYSNQTVINKENVGNLQFKWRLINNVEITRSTYNHRWQRLRSRLCWQYYSI